MACRLRRSCEKERRMWSGQFVQRPFECTTLVNLKIITFLLTCIIFCVAHPSPCRLYTIGEQALELAL
uniref:Uncharacterized protein n=1 Tax=Hyaloperonospora arabidopsidis (strain Emoy2) TaxID=559515 RepID=M4BBL8_HYAAE